MQPIILPAAELKSALSGLSKIIPSKSADPVLRSLKVERTSEGWICLSATDLDRFVTVRFEQPTQGEPLAFLVPYDELLKVTKTCGRSERLQLEPKSKDTVSIKFALANQLGETTVSSLPLEKFPELPKIKTPSIPLPESLRLALHEAMACASNDDTRYVLQSAFIDVTKSQGHYVVGTDGRHLYSSNSFTLPLKQSLIIPKHKFLGWKDFNLDGEWQLKIADVTDAKTPPLIQISSRRWRFITKQIESQYPAWRQTVPEASAYQSTVVLPPDQLANIIQIMERMPCHDQRYHTLGLQWQNQQLHLLGKDKDQSPWTRVPLQGAKVQGKAFTVFCDRTYLSKALEFGLNTISIIDEKTPLKVSHAGRQMIIMPIRQEEPITPPPNPKPQKTVPVIPVDRQTTISPPSRQTMPNTEPPEPVQFKLGQTLITPNAQNSANPVDLLLSLQRHSSGDWGDCDPEDAQANDHAVKHGLRIFSVYHDRNGVKLWIITEADRSATTILLPEDY